MCNITLNIQSSIRDNAGKKPFVVWSSISQGTVGSYDTVIFNPPLDRTYEITNASMYFGSGTNTGYLQLTLTDGSNYDVLIRYNSPAVNYFYTFMGVAPFESPFWLQIHYTATTTPYNLYTSVGGWMYKRGEGVLD